MVTRLFIIIFFFSFFVFCQSKEDKILKFKSDSICLTKDLIFCKATYYYQKKNVDSTYIYAEKALAESSSIEELDILYYIQGWSAIEKKLYKKGLSRISKISKKSFLTSLKNFNLGRIYIELKDYKKALIHYSNWENNNQNNGAILKKGGYHNLGICHIYLKNYVKAKEYFDKELNLIYKKDTLGLVILKMDLANVYYNQYLDDKAIPLFKEAYNLAKNYSNTELKQNTALNMAVVEENRKRYKESVIYYKEYDKWKDSIWNRDKIWELTEKDKQLAVAQKQQEIALQEEQIKRQKVVQKGLLLGASGLLTFIGGLGYFYRKLKKQKQLITEQKEALDVANKTKNYLFSVVSHDLRSPINTIKRQHKKLAKHIANNDLPAIKEANQQAISVTDSTSHLLNNVLQWSLEQSNQLNFSQEDYALQPIIEHILFDYEDVAESHNIAISTNFEDDIVVKTDKESLKIVLRNLIDNSIKYMNGAGSIEITTTTQNNQARIEIKDSGIGISEEKLQKINALKDLSVDKIDRSKGVGLGLILCQTLIKKNNGTLFFESVEGESTTAILLLPLV